MDGNGRWANKHNLPRIEGHRRGIKAVKRILKAVRENDIPYLTLYAFSVENWNRPKEEIDALMNLLNDFLTDQLKELLRHKVRLRVIGRHQELPRHIQERLNEAEAKTAQFTRHTLALALNYGSRTEIIDAIKAVTRAVQDGEVDLNRFDYESLRPFLYTGEIPDPDLIIRTSGESRLSNFLMLQSAYSEIYFSPVLWPDFNEKTFQTALNEFGSRERRYGKTTDQLQNS